MKKQLYVGLATPKAWGLKNWSAAGGLNTSGFPNGNARPPYFMGLRYDTDPGTGALTLSSVANASGGNTVYQGTITNGGTNNFVGTKFLVAGFGNANNNGTFECVANTTSAITLANPNGSNSGSPTTGTATGPALSDSTFKFEVAQNHNLSNNRINNNTGVIDTTITPVAEVQYRFDMTCTASGTIVMTLSGGGLTATHTFTGIAQITSIGQTGAMNLGLHRTNGYGEISVPTQATSINNNPPLAAGTKVTISGASNSTFNSTFPIVHEDIGGTNSPGYLFVLVGTTLDEANSAATLTYHPGVIPYLGFGNDTQASPSDCSIAIDYFGLSWNTGIQTTPNAIDATQGRYI